MKVPVLPALIFLALAVALYLLPDGAFHSWRQYLHGAVSRLESPPEGEDRGERADYSGVEDLLDRLRQKDAQIAALGQRLRDFGLARQAVEDVSIIQARIVQLGPNQTLDTFTIDAGEEHGVSAGDAVTVGQAVAGVVAQVGERSALVLSLSSPGCYLSVRLGPAEGADALNRELCAVQGSGRGGVKVVLFSSGSEASPGWVALTSGLEKGVPEGLVVGMVAGDFVEGEEAGTLEAELRPRADLNALDYVTVLARK